jgi:hypothetical protein
MKIGDLYIEVGTKGGPETSQQLTTIRAGLQDVKSMGLATKAAIAGVLYELKNLSQQSMAMGLGLQQFGNLTGISPDALQKWQFALQQSGVSADETAQSIKHLQDVTNDIILNGNIPAGFKVIAESVHLDPTRLRDTLYVYDKFREYARTHRDNPDMTRSLLAPTIGNDKVIQALMSGTFDPSKTPRGQSYTKGQTKALADDAIHLKNITTQWEHFLGKLTAEHGSGVLDKVGQFSIAIQGLVTALDELGKSLHVFDILADGADVGTGLVNYLKDLATPTEKGIAKTKKLEHGDLEKRRKEWHRLHPSLGAGAGSVKSTTLNQTVHVHGAEKPQESGHAVKHEVGRAFRQLQDGQVD